MTRRAAPVLLLAVALLPACAPGVEQARQVTAELKSEDFTPPPRSAADVLARLDAPATSVELERRRALAAQEPPAGAGEAALAVFHLRRGRAAMVSGRLDRYLDDLRRAAANLERATGFTRTDAREILRELRTAESQVGRYGAAIDAIARAQRLQGGSVVNDVILAELLLRVGDHAEGVEAANRARQRFATQRRSDDPSAPNSSAVAEALVAGAEGRWEEAEVYWRKALSLQTMAFSTPAIRSVELGASEEVARAQFRMRIAGALRRQGRALEAEILARESLQAMLAAFGPANLSTVEAVNELALAVLDQGRDGDAERLARAALTRLDAMATPSAAPIRALVRLTLVRTLLPRRDWPAAGRELTALRDALADNRAMLDRALGHDADVPLTLLKSGRTAEALALAEAGHRALAATLGAASAETARMQAVLALALAASGRPAPALAAFRAALPALLADAAGPVGNVPTGQGADWRQPIFIEGYVGLLAQSGGRAAAEQAGLDAAAESFRVADLARAGSAQRAITANAARAASRTPELADLVRREQDAHAQSLALLGELADATLSRPAPPDPKAKATLEAGAEAAKARGERSGELKTKIADLTAARRALRAEIERRFPDYASLVSPRPVTIDDARRALAPGEVLLAFLAGDEQTFVWAVPREGAVRFTAAALGRGPLTTRVAGLRRGTTLPDSATLDDVPAFDVAAAHELYRLLLEPVASAWKDGRALVSAPHGPLGQLPLSVLVTAAPPRRAAGSPRFAEYRGVAWLARTHALTTVPSVASLVAVRRLPAGNPAREPFVGFGDPQFGGAPALAGAPGAIAARRLGVRGGPSPGAALATQLSRLEPLPDTAEELRSIAQSLGASPERDVFLGRDAAEERVKTMDLSRRRVIAFATHALVTGELDGLDEPALALSAPARPGAGDGLLTLGEMLALRLDADWMLLSACNTAAGAAADAEVLSGLGRAAFYAGARALLVSHWAVESSSARRLTTGVLERQRHARLTRAEALRQSMLALIDGAGPAHLAHPVFWAPFVLVGDGG